MMLPMLPVAARAAVVLALLVSWNAADARAQDLRRGVILDDVTCLADPTQTYALYVPSTYSHERRWNLLMAFHPGARGRAMVEKYQAAAEQYGYIVAGSNRSRNGPWEVSGAAVKAMSADLGQRLSIDPQRIYLSGLSGGARVAMQVALTNKHIAGVIASSGGYPDSQPRSKVGFAVFGTAGDEDFNYIEMRLLDRKLTSPHRLAVFTGGHTLPPDEVAFDAIEWMELQAMKSGRRARDEALIDRWMQTRQAAIAASTGGAATVHLLEALVDDFDGLRDVAAEAARLKELSKQRDVRDALERERDAADAEARMLADIVELESRLGDESRRGAALATLRDRLGALAQKAATADASSERSQARRVLRAITSGAGSRVEDREYRALLEQYGQRGRGR
jgi:dienelactone hydrolase